MNVKGMTPESIFQGYFKDAKSLEQVQLRMNDLASTAHVVNYSSYSPLIEVKVPEKSN